MHRALALALGFALLLAPGVVRPVHGQPKPPTEEQIKAWLKKLEEPTRHESDPEEGPPDGGVGPTFGYKWHIAALGQLRRAGEAALPGAYKLLEDTTKSGQTRAQAASLVVERLKGKGAKQEPDRKALEALKAALKDKDLSLKWGVLGNIGAYGAASVREWSAITVQAVPTLDRDSLHFSDAAMDGLLPEVIALVPHEEPEIAARAAGVLFSFGRPKEGLKELLGLLDRREQRVRASAVAALSRVGVDDPEALKAVLGELKPEHYGEWYGNVIKAVARFGPKAKDAVPALADVIKKADWEKDETKYLVETAIESLGKIGPNAKGAVPQLLKFAEEHTFNSQGSRDNLVTALDKIDPEAAKKVRAIFKRQFDDFIKTYPNPNPPPKKP